MWRSQLWVMSLAIFLFATALHSSQDPKSVDTTIKSSVYLSPPFFQQPGSVVNKYYFNISFPTGHIALKSFHAEVVDEMGIPVPLHETYLHHWVVQRYNAPVGAIIPREVNARDLDLSKINLMRNSGICKGTLDQYFGLGSETRETATWIPEPYGIEVGNPEEIPDGYEERWYLNVHAIDTRGVTDRLGCTECKCSLYNIVTVDEFGHPLRKGYDGGLYCCYDRTQCRLKDGFMGVERKLYLRYTMSWVDVDDSIVPVKIYILDVTDTRGVSNDTTAENARRTCLVEYTVEACGIEGKANVDQCVDTKKTRIVIPRGGDIVYGFAHQHAGGIGSSLYGQAFLFESRRRSSPANETMLVGIDVNIYQDGRVLCTSIPTYGRGKEAGNEAGYIVGMSTCYPKPGSVRVADGEILTLESNYNSTQQHTGVMGLFYILVAEPQPKQEALLHYSLAASWVKERLKNYSWGFILGGGIVAAVIVFIP